MAKKYHIKWAAPAREDINEIIDYISQTNINYAVKVLNKIEDHVKKLDLFPERYRIVPELERYGYLLYREIIVDWKAGSVPRQSNKLPLQRRYLTACREVLHYWRIIFKIENNFVYIMLIVDSRRNLEDLIIKKIILREKEI